MHNGKNGFGGPGAIRLAIRIGQRTSTITWESCEVHRLTVCGQCRAPLLSCAPWASQASSISKDPRLIASPGQSTLDLCAGSSGKG
ncbi:hypothetical protein NXS19_010383 [Fusarium pseudograminearum]|nr:hypothetical protein NXS19_010383 [Fusarium pseudograminearum]